MLIPRTRQIACLFLLLPVLAQATGLNELTSDLKQQKISAEQKIDPLVQEAAALEAEKAAIELEQTKRAERIKELQTKQEVTFKEIQSNVSFQAIKDLLLNNGQPKVLGSCEVSLGKEENELYISDKRSKLRIIFADENSSQKPVAKLIKKEGLSYIEIRQNDFDPKQTNKKTGPMKAILHIDQETHLVTHAQFKGEAIGDRLGYFSSYSPIALTCLNDEADKLF